MHKINSLIHLSLVKPNHSTALEEVFTFKMACDEEKNLSYSRLIDLFRIFVSRNGAERRSGFDLR